MDQIVEWEDIRKKLHLSFASDVLHSVGGGGGTGGREPGSNGGGKSTGGGIFKGGGSWEKWKNFATLAQYIAIGKAHRGGNRYGRG